MSFGASWRSNAVAIEVKICGITDPDDARQALACGADYLGFVLYARSPRAVSPERVREIREQLEPGARCVAVVVDPERGMVEALIHDAQLHAVQFCGNESPEDLAGFDVPVWRSLRLGEGGWQPAAPAQWAVERYVIDANVPGEFGGTGCRADWAGGAALAREYPVMLSGGLTPENVASGIKAVRPCGVDVASGVEAEPGKKDHARVKAFIEAARAAGD